MKKIQTKKPIDNSFTQQRLAAWQPILSPAWVIFVFSIIFIIFTPLGILIILTSINIVEVEKYYHESCTMNYRIINGTENRRLGKQCTVNIGFEIKEKMEQPIYLYYKLDNFYQNHRRYANSRSDTQLQGNSLDYSSSKSSCFPIFQYSNLTDVEVGNRSNIYNPCGLIAWSMFNDTFVLKDGNNIICDGPNPQSSKCSKDNIAWASDVSTKFRPPNPLNRIHPQEYFNEEGHQIPNTTDPDFIVWMRTAALPSFRKLYRVINTPLNPGNYTMTIVQNYNVSPFNGAKAFVLTTSSWIGGKNLFLGICYLVVAGICLLLACAFMIASLIQSKRKK